MIRTGRKWWVAALAGLLVTAPEAAHAQALHPQWSPTGAWIAYYQRTGSRASLYIVRPDGSGRTELTIGPDYDANPTWGPGGHELAFARGVGGMRETWDVFVLDVGSDRITRLTHTPEREVHTSWSPDGRLIAFVRMDEDGSDLFVMNRDGSDVRRLTQTSEREFHPKWSPDGRSLVYDLGDDASRDIWAIDVESGETRRLTEVGRGNFASTPAWAPDGSRFSFALRAEGGPEGMYVADANGSNVRPLDTGGLAAGASFWSPDGEYVAFHAGSEGAYGVYVVLADGGEAVKVSE